MLLNGGFAIVGFSGVLWSIHPQCFMVAAAYALLGTLLTMRLGRPLVGLNYNQLDREAEFRAGLLHVWENAESVAMVRREESVGRRLRRQLDAAMANAKRIIEDAPTRAENAIAA